MKYMPQRIVTITNTETQNTLQLAALDPQGVVAARSGACQTEAEVSVFGIRCLEDLKVLCV